jgi:hypothetical protein
MEQAGSGKGGAGAPDKSRHWHCLWLVQVHAKKNSCSGPAYSCLLTLLSTHRNIASFPRSDFKPRGDIPPDERPAAVVDASCWGCEED